MSARNEILTKIRENIAPTQELPKIEVTDNFDGDLGDKYAVQASLMGSTVVNVAARDSIKKYLHDNVEGGEIISFCDLFPSTLKIERPPGAGHLSAIETTIVESQMGVAENGTVWISDQVCSLRVAPFICQHLIVLLSKQNIVRDMHDAYQHLSDKTFEFGSWIGGPSKTADIEQTLVIGAQGAKQMTVILYP